jgi:ribosomal protein S6
MSEKEVVYELAYVLRVGESESVIDEVLAAHKAVVKHKSPVSSIQLAYPIKKQGVAQFGYTHLTLPTGGAVKEISDALQLKDAVLRFLFTKVPKLRLRARPEGKGKVEGAAAEKPASVASLGRIDSLSNEKLSQTLEEILK